MVVEHQWDGSPYYSLYAHLAKISVTPGEEVRQGQPLGLMGYSGSGIDQRRAHTHFEICLLLSTDFEALHQRYFSDSPNKRGIYNGMNLSGLDAAALILAWTKQPDLTIPAFLARQPEVFRVAIPSQPLDLLQRYPWLQKSEGTQAMEISFTGSGLPVRIEARAGAVIQPTVTWVAETRFPLRYVTRGYVTGNPGSAVLTESGRQFIALLTGH